MRSLFAAAAALLVLPAVLGLTELTGVTNLRGAVLRLFSSEKARTVHEAAPVAATPAPVVRDRPAAEPPGAF